QILREVQGVYPFLDEAGEITKEARAGKPCLVRIDSKTTETESGKAFIQRPNQLLKTYNVVGLLYTPSMGVGVSIDEDTQRKDDTTGKLVPYFEVVFGLFLGVIEPSQCRQQLARIRANVPRVVWAKDNHALEGCKSFFPDDVKRQLFKYHHSTLNIIDLAKGIAGYDADDEQIRQVMLDLLTEAWDDKSKTWNNPHLNLYAKLKARRNYGLCNLTKLLREELEEEGHRVIAIGGEWTETEDEIQQIKADLKELEAQKIASASLIPLEDAKKILNRIDSTKQERFSAQKTVLQDELPEVELTKDFIHKAVTADRRRWLNQHKLFWYFTNPEATKSLDTDNWLRHLDKFAANTPYTPDIRSFTPKIKALQDSGLFDWVDLQNSERVYQGDRKDAKAFITKAFKAREDIKTAFDLSVTRATEPISFANRLLAKVGLKLVKVTKSKKDNRYKIAVDLIDDPDRLAVLRALDLRWQKSREEVKQKSPQTQSQQALQPGGEVPVYIDLTASSPPIVQGSQQGASGFPGEAGCAGWEGASAGCESREMANVGCEGCEESEESEAIAGVTTYLSLIESKEDYESAKADVEPRIFEAAWQRLSAERQQEIVSWFEPSLPRFSVGQRLRGLFGTFAGKVVKIAAVFEDYCETIEGLYITPECIQKRQWELI
ncbi:MAG TPA: hypothetical protein V6C85_23620, partial [Allocoleopsis sp.]